MTARIAVINDDTAFLALMRELLTEEGYETHSFVQGVNDCPAVRDLHPEARPAVSLTRPSK
jgi:hypothetical protein